MKGRIYILLVLSVIGFILVIGQLFRIQVLEGGRYREIGERNWSAVTRLERQRGTIYDRRGRELAVSLSVKSLAANPSKFPTPESRARVARRIAPLLGVDPDFIEGRLERNPEAEFVWLARKVADDVAESIAIVAQTLEEKRGLFFQNEYRRYYPCDSSAAHILGFVGIDDEGLEGIEKSQNEILKGPAIEGSFVRDAMGNPVPVNGMIEYRKFDGNSIYLTIDLAIQSSLEQALYRQVQAYGAKSASGIVMDPMTGEILALANYPTFNPNELVKSTADDRRNRAITDLFEPGSTFKVFSGSVALTENLVKESDEFNCVGSLMVFGHPIKCHHAHGTVNYRKAIEVSCNVAAMLVAQRLNPEVMYRGLKAFGFGARSGIELPGEAAGVLRPVRAWSGLSLSTIALGQEVSSTTLQLVNAVASMSNGGRLMKPHIVMNVRNAAGRSIRSFPPEVRSRSVSPVVARLMGSIMEGVVTQGTGTQAEVKPFRVSGKTGTGQISGPRGGYIKGRYNAVFAGWTPTEAPVLAMAIVVHDPDPSKGYYGGQVAAPVFGWVGTEAMRYLRVRTGTSADSILTSARPAVERVSEGAVRGGKVEVPDLKGLTLREVHELMSRLPLGFTPNGSGIATSQSIPAGTMVPLDSVLRVDFHPPAGTEQFADVSEP